MDSIFFSAGPIIQKRFPNHTFSDIVLSKHILDITSEVQLYLNNSYDYFAQKFCNLDKHRFEIKQEVIAKSALFITKKRYAMRIINDNGVRVNKLLIKGMDIVRSNFATGFRTVLQAVVEDVLAKVPKEKIDTRILEFRKNMALMDIRELATPTGVNGIKKYTKSRISKSLSKFTSSSGKSVMSQFVKGAPAHVKAAIAYNDLLRDMKLNNKYSYIRSGDKIRHVYLKSINPYKIDSLAFRGDEDPEEIMSFIKEYIDIDKTYDRQLKKKFSSVYTVLHWSTPVNKKFTLERFF